MLDVSNMKDMKKRTTTEKNEEGLEVDSGD
jgi:hypothetical protein